METHTDDNDTAAVADDNNHGKKLQNDCFRSQYLSKNSLCYRKLFYNSTMKDYLVCILS